MKKAILLVGLIISGFGLAQNIKASQYFFFDNFDSYATGSLYEKGDWIVSPSSTWEISGDISTSSPNSLHSGSSTIDQSPYINNFTTTTRGVLSFNLYISTSTSGNFFSVHTGLAPDNTNLYVECEPMWYGDDKCALKLVQGSFGTENLYIYLNQWVTLIWEVNYASQTQNLFYIHGNQQEKLSTSTDPDGSYVKNVYLGFYQNKTAFYIDNIQYLGTGIQSPTYPFTGFFFDDTAFATFQPFGCQYNQVATNTATTINFPVYFQFTNASGSNTVYNNFYIKFYDSEGNSTSVITSQLSLNPGSAYSEFRYITLPAKTWRIEYNAEGYDQTTGIFRSFVSGGSSQAGNTCNCTSIGYQSTATANVCNFGQIGYLACQSFTENCLGTSTSWTDTILCNIEGFAVGLLCPSLESYSKALGILTDIKTRFPISYYLAASTSIGAFQAGIVTSTATSTPTSTYYTVNILEWRGLANLQLIQILRNIFMYAIILYGIYYIVKYTSKNLFK